METKLGKKDVLLFKNSEIEYAPMSVNGGSATLASVVKKYSKTMDAGFIEMKESYFEWTLHYDEVFYIISGSMFIEANNEKIYANAGDIYYLTKGTKVVYGTDSEVKLFYSIYPGNWRELLNQ